MITSMTGFGKNETSILNKKIAVEIRTLNSKNIDLNFRVPHVFKELEPQLRSIVSEQLNRGKIDVSVYMETDDGSSNTTRINKKVVDDYIEQLNQIHQGDRIELLKMAIKLPDAPKTEKEDLKKEEKEALLSVFSEALLQVNDYRINEGAALEKDFDQRLEVLGKLLKEVIRIDPERKEKVSLKLRNSIEQLTVEVDQNRMEQELIYFLEKYDITEEKVRLKNHLEYFTTTLNETESNGKKLGL